MAAKGKIKIKQDAIKKYGAGSAEVRAIERSQGRGGTRAERDPHSIKRLQRAGVKDGYYTVQEGDNYFALADQLFGNQRFAGALMQGNQTSFGNARFLTPGMRIKVPNVDTTRDPYFGPGDVRDALNIGDRLGGEINAEGKGTGALAGFDLNTYNRLYGGKYGVNLQTEGGVGGSSVAGGTTALPAATGPTAFQDKQIQLGNQFNQQGSDALRNQQRGRFAQNIANAIAGQNTVDVGGGGVPNAPVNPVYSPYGLPAEAAGASTAGLPFLNQAGNFIQGLFAGQGTAGPIPIGGQGAAPSIGGGAQLGGAIPGTQGNLQIPQAPQPQGGVGLAAGADPLAAQTGGLNFLGGGQSQESIYAPYNPAQQAEQNNVSTGIHGDPTGAFQAQIVSGSISSGTATSVNADTLAIEGMTAEEASVLSGGVYVPDGAGGVVLSDYGRQVMAQQESAGYADNYLKQFDFFSGGGETEGGTGGRITNYNDLPPNLPILEERQLLYNGLQLLDHWPRTYRGRRYYRRGARPARGGGNYAPAQAGTFRLSF